MALPAATPVAPEFHRATTETLLELLKRHERSVVPAGARWLVSMDMHPTHCSEETPVGSAKDIPKLTACYMPARTTSFLQLPEVAFMGPLQAQLRKLCALDLATDLFATLLEETAGEPVERTRVDSRLSTLKRHIPGWVDEAMENLSLRADIHERGWRHFHCARRSFSSAKGLSRTRQCHGRPEGCVHREASTRDGSARNDPRGF